MEINRSGITRIVFLIGDLAVKIPNFTLNHRHFLQGCYANWSERTCYKYWRKCNYSELYELVCPSYFCSWFGLIQVQKRISSLDRELTKEEIYRFKGICGQDIKKENFGYHRGKVVCLDYP